MIMMSGRYLLPTRRTCAGRMNTYPKAGVSKDSRIASILIMPQINSNHGRLGSLTCTAALWTTMLKTQSLISQSLPRLVMMMMTMTVKQVIQSRTSMAPS